LSPTIVGPRTILKRLIRLADRRIEFALPGETRDGAADGGQKAVHAEHHEGTLITKVMTQMSTVPFRLNVQDVLVTIGTQR
jgi:hypothetical protein